MRPIIFLFSDLKMNVGGNIAQAKFEQICSTFTSTEVVTYGDPVPGYRHLDELLADNVSGGPRPIFIIHWGPHIPMLIERLSGEDVIYFAHSTGWGATIPSTVPIFTVSRNTLGFWGRHAANSLLRYVPNLVENETSTTSWHDRPIDVLVQKRKSSDYLIDELIPALQPICDVVVLDGWVDSLAAELAKSKVYLYDSTEHWIAKGATEGFGLPPIEALAAGCVVFSSVNDALADFLDPGVNCQKLRTHSVAYDTEMIRRSLQTGTPRADTTPLMLNLRHAAISEKLKSAMADAEQFFGISKGRPSTIREASDYARPHPHRSFGQRLQRRAANLFRSA